MNIRHVARKARVSTATVSRTINDPGQVSRQTAERVRRAIRGLNYHPNIHARTLVSGRSRLLGLIISDIANPFFPELVKGFEDAALQNSYEVMVTNTNYSPSRMAECVRRMLERKVDGVAIMTSEMDRSLIEELARRGVPIVFLDVGRVQRRMSNICVDYAGGIREAVEHLLALGHRRIAFISGPLGLKSARIRRSAFLKTLQRYGIYEDKDLVVEGNHKIDGGQSAMQRLLDLPDPPTAVLTSNDLTALGALGTLHKAGRRVPEEISVVGFDDIDLAQYTQPPLTTIRLSRSELGHVALDALVRSISGDSLRGRKYSIETHLVTRESTGPGPRAGIGPPEKAAESVPR